MLSKVFGKKDKDKNTQNNKHEKDHVEEESGANNSDDTVESDRAFELQGENKSSFISFMSKLSIGMELSKIIAPSWLLEGVSLLELLSNFMKHPELFSNIADCNTPEERLVAVIRWYLSTIHSKIVKKKPYNPVIGEEFVASWNGDFGEVSFHSEQVSHHPPISAYYFENKEKKLILSGYNWSKTKFSGTSIKVPQEGLNIIHDVKHDEHYEIVQPTVVVGGILLGKLQWEFVGPCKITCKETGFYAEIDFKSKPWFRGEYDVINGRVYFGANKKDKEFDAAITGKWSKEVTIEYTESKKSEILLSISELPVIEKKVPPPEEQTPNNSLQVWGKVTEALKKSDWKTADEEKDIIEKNQRKELTDRKAKKQLWKQAHFHLNEIDDWIYDNYNGTTLSEDEKRTLKKGFCKMSDDVYEVVDTTES